MKPEELSDAIIEFQSKHTVSDTTLAFASHLSVQKAQAMKSTRCWTISRAISRAKCKQPGQTARFSFALFSLLFPSLIFFIASLFHASYFTFCIKLKIVRSLLCKGQRLLFLNSCHFYHLTLTRYRKR